VAKKADDGSTAFLRTETPTQPWNYEFKLVLFAVISYTQCIFLPARRYASAGTSYGPVSLCVTVILINYYYHRYSITHSLSFQAQNLPFLQILPTAAFPFLLQDSLRGFRLFTVTSQNIPSFTFSVFTLFSCRFRAVD